MRRHGFPASNPAGTGIPARPHSRRRRAFSHGRVERLTLPTPARSASDEARRCLENLLASGATIYGVNTGFGKLANQRIEPHEVLALQENLLRSHAVGMGPLLSIGVSRLALALRIQALAKGYSGVTPELIERLIEMYNRGVVPAIPEQGSVGASGDLAPLAHLALVVMGEGEAFVVNPGRRPSAPSRPKPLSGRAALRHVHLKPYRPQAKEGLSLINGTQISTAFLADALVRAWQLARIADIAGAMTVEATKSSQQPFDPRIQQIRPHPGQIACAGQPAPLARRQRDHGLARRLRQGAGCLQHALHAAGPRHLPRRAGATSTQMVECEMNSATDNPLVFADTDEVISGGNFHAQPIALAADLLAAARHRPVAASANAGSRTWSIPT